MYINFFTLYNSGLKELKIDCVYLFRCNGAEHSIKNHSAIT